MGRLVRVGVVVGADESLLGMLATGAGVYIAREVRSVAGAAMQVAGGAGMVDETSRGEPMLLLSLARGPGWFFCASLTSEQ